MLGPAACGRVARREVATALVHCGTATTKGPFDRRSGLACTASAHSEGLDWITQREVVAMNRFVATSGHGMRRRALRPLPSGTITASYMRLDGIGRSQP